MSVEEAFITLKKETARMGLTIIFSKTKYMIAGRNRGTLDGGADACSMSYIQKYGRIQWAGHLV